MIVLVTSLLLDLALIPNALVPPIQAGETPSAAPESRFVPEWFPKAPPMAPPKGDTITVTTVDELFHAVENINVGGTILLSEGRYRLSRPIILREKKNISIRSASGDPAKVTLCGKGWDSEAKGDDILRIAHCDGVTIADLTFADCRSYGIKVEAENAPKNVHIYNCRFRNIGVRAIKGSAGKDPKVRAVKGSVRYCRFENTRIPPAHWLFRGDYISAIDKAVSLADVTEDIRRLPRSGNPDLGAWELDKKSKADG
jgi:hypothetical protein